MRHLGQVSQQHTVHMHNHALMDSIVVTQSHTYGHVAMLKYRKLTCHSMSFIPYYIYVLTLMYPTST